jgi:SAM-dependent methyltransferase
MTNMKKIQQFPSDDLIKNTRIFHEYINDLGMDNGWDDGNQIENFQYLSRIEELAEKPFNEASILDVGCGTGDLSAFLREKGISDYVGIDIYEPSLERARERYPQETFINGDLLTMKFEKKFDYAFCSGGLTLNLSIDNYEFLYSMIDVMWNSTTVGVAFNFLSSDDPDPDTDLFFYNPERVIELCQTIAPDAIISAVTSPNEYQVTVYMYRE